MQYFDVPYISIAEVVDVFFEEHNGQDVNLIVIGANSGEIDDFLSEYVRKERVTGIMVEPLPDLYRVLREKYGNRKNLYYENSAVANRNGKKALYYLDTSSAKLPSWCNGLGTFNRKTILNHSNQVPGIEKYVQQTTVNCITFDSLLKKYQIDKVNLLQIDTEGYDFEIIKSIDFSKHAPQIIIVEYLHLSFYQYFSMICLLREHHYSVHKGTTSYDLVAVHESVLQ